MRFIISCILFLYVARSDVVSAFAEEQMPPSADGGDTSRIRVFDDSGIIGALGTFHGPGDTIELETMPPAGDAPEGTEVLMARCRVGPSGWAGLFFKTGSMEQDKAIDASRYAEDGEVRFWIRSTRDVQVGIRSRNIAPGREHSKLWLRREKLAKLDQGRWERVSIELRRFAALEPRLRFTEMQVMLMVAFTDDGLGAGAHWVAIDEVAWFLSSDSRESPRRSAPLPVNLGVEDFHASDYQGGSCRLSNADGRLEQVFGRPSSGRSSTVLDFKEGTVSFTWDIMGIGHGYQIVLPFGDPRYPVQLEHLAEALRSWADVKVTRYEPEPKTSPLPVETRTKLNTAAAKLLQLRLAYPDVKHDPEEDATWEGEGANAVLLLWATASNAVKLEVIGKMVTKASIEAPKGDREPADPEVRRRHRRQYSFAGLLPFPPSVYEEVVGQTKLQQLRRFEMTPGEGGFRVRIPVWRGKSQFQYAIVAQGENDRATVCLLGDRDVFVSTE